MIRTIASPLGASTILFGLLGTCLGQNTQVARQSGQQPVAVAAKGQAAAPATSQPAARGGHEQEEALILVLKSDAPLKDKADACRKLAGVGTRNAVEPLARLLHDEKLSHMARYGLEPIPDQTVDEAFREALKDLKGRLLVGVIGSIGVRRDVKAVEPLAGLLKNSDHDVAQAAARALGLLATPTAVEALERAADTTPQAERPAIYEGLFRAAEARVSQGKRDGAVAIYERLNHPDVPLQVRESAARKLRALRQPDGPRL
jgi:HEAT repeat protein